jgi:hypothetical protein
VIEGRSPSLKSLPPLLEKERGIKGVRLINDLVLPAIIDLQVESG